MGYESLIRDLQEGMTHKKELTHFQVESALEDVYYLFGNAIRERYLGRKSLEVMAVENRVTPEHVTYFLKVSLAKLRMRL